jgi:hypothetical protein
MCIIKLVRTLSNGILPTAIPAPCLGTTHMAATARSARSTAPILFLVVPIFMAFIAFGMFSFICII